MKGMFHWIKRRENRTLDLVRFLHWLIMQLLVLLFTSSITIMANTVIAPALPSISAAFAAEDPQGLRTRFLLTAPAIVTIFAAPLAGLLGDHWKRIPILLLGLLCFAAFGSAGLWVDDLHTLMISRLFLGLAVGMLISTTSSLVGDYYSGAQRTQVMGYQGMSNALGGVVFMMAGGALSGYSWRGPFGVYLIGILFAVMAWRALPEPAKHDYKPVGGAMPVVVKTRWGQIGLMYATGMLGISAFFLIPVNVAYLLLNRFDISGLHAGLIMASSTLTTALVSLFYAKIRAALGRNGTFVLTFVSMAIAMWILSWAPTLPLFLLGMLFNGVGLGCMFPNTTGSVLELSPPHLRGRLMGFMSSFFFLGQFISPIFSALVISHTNDLSVVFEVAAAGLLAMAFAYGLMSFFAMGKSAGERG